MVFTAPMTVNAINTKQEMKYSILPNKFVDFISDKVQKTIGADIAIAYKEVQRILKSYTSILCSTGSRKLSANNIMTTQQQHTVEMNTGDTWFCRENGSKILFQGLFNVILPL